MSIETVEATCPYCHHKNMLDWKVGDESPRIVLCGEYDVTIAASDKVGCFKNFVVSIKWTCRVNVQAIGGEAPVLRGG